jgi:type II secretory ATPase GspE/PulE/Tfp pilus assembly ATPase PilB-like protein
MTATDELVFRLAVESGLLRERDGSSCPARPIAEFVASGLLPADAPARLLGECFQLPWHRRLGGAGASIATELLDIKMVERLRVVPLGLEGGRLRLAVADPLDESTLAEVARGSCWPVSLEIASGAAIDEEIGRHRTLMAEATSESEVREAAAPLVPGSGPGVKLAPDVSIAQRVRSLVAEALRKHASDIHLEPMEGRVRLRFRIDGVLTESIAPSTEEYPAVLAQLKLQAGLSLAERRLPQDGRLGWRSPGVSTDMRVSTVPTRFGESVVLRILDPGAAVEGLDQLGLTAEDAHEWRELIAGRDGLLLVTGPTGSGKTTTLYAFLRELAAPTRKLVTVEDPIEYRIAGVSQVPVRTEVGMTFAGALRAILRQSPDVVMVGEIRDRETAEIALQAALTGHLVLSTLHTNDAAGAVERLRNLGVRPVLLDAALRGVLAQRLVRRVCRRCGRERPPRPAERALLRRHGIDGTDVRLARGDGCPACRNSGYGFSRHSAAAPCAARSATTACARPPPA